MRVASALTLCGRGHTHSHSLSPSLAAAALAQPHSLTHILSLIDSLFLAFSDSHSCLSLARSLTHAHSRCSRSLALAAADALTSALSPRRVGLLVESRGEWREPRSLSSFVSERRWNQGAWRLTVVDTCAREELRQQQVYEIACASVEAPPYLQLACFFCVLCFLPFSFVWLSLSLTSKPFFLQI